LIDLLERKYMSTKTLTKRVALATVVALGAGVLSLVTVSSASAAPLDPYSSGSDVTNVYLNSGDGLSYGVTDGARASLGLLGNPAGANLLQTATVLSNGAVTVGYTQASPGSSNLPGIQVTGGTITKAEALSVRADAAGPTAAVSTSFQVTGGNVVTANTGTINLAASIVPNAGATTMTIGFYKGLSTAATSVSGGILDKQIVVSVAAASTAGVVSTTNSKLLFPDPASNPQNAVSSSSAAATNSADYLTSIYFTIAARDAYKAKLAAGALVQASASNGALVSIGNNATNATIPSISSAFALSLTGVDQVVQVTAGALAKTGGSTTVTVSINGVVIGTAGLTFTGPVKTVKLGAAGNAYNGAGAVTANAISMSFLDAAGNSVYIPSAGSTAYPNAFTKDSNAFKVTGTSVLAASGSSNLVWPTSATVTGKFYVTCPSGVNVTDAAAIDYTNGDGTTVISNAVPFTCTGAADTYTAKLDKSSYNPGEVATLSVTFKDVKGSVANDSATGITNGGTTTPVISGAYLTAVSAPTNADVTVNGVATYKFVVGQPFNQINVPSQMTVSFPTVNSANGSAQTVSYTVTSGGGTSLNDVLKGIVSLIASINKQIAALAKLVTKKK